MKKGVFIVIDGTDGSGKQTQSKLLIERMQSENLPVETISFPQYGKKSASPVEEYLSGKYGDANDVGPKASSILYAVDRFDASKQISKWLQEGKHVIADRYVGSNMAHQGSKIDDANERHAYYDWNRELEFSIFNIPEPDANIILHVPADISIELIRQREGKAGVQNDIHENIEHIKAAERTYLELAERFDEFKKISCAPEGELLSRENINNEIWNIVKPLLDH